MKEYIFNIHDVVLLMTAAECILLALFQAALPVKDRLYGHLLSAFLVAIATSAAATLVLWNDQVHISPVVDQYWVPYFLMAALMLKGSSLYLYVASITRANFRLRPVHLAHLLPALLTVLVMAVFGIDGNDLRHLWTLGEPQPERVVTFLWDAVKLVPLLYSFAAVVLVQRYKSELKDEYSHFSSTEPRWLNILTLGFFISWSWTVVVHLIAKFTTPETADYLGIADNYITFILINGLFTYSLAYAHQLLATRSEDTRAPAAEKPSEAAIERVRKAMEEDKIYLQHNLNIEQFSAYLDLPVKEVSAVINKHFGTNFFEFINSYRVEEAKHRLADSTLSEQTILDILLDSGFNSKSAFHRFFKRLVGESPSEYRKRMHSEP